MTAGTDPDLLLHIATAAPWRMALGLGTLVTPSLVLDGFIHMSTPEQVELPANRLYAGRDDLLLLVIDPWRLPGEIQWEPGVPTDPDSMRFPHLYGPLPVSVVTSVLPWARGDDGQFHRPRRLPAPADRTARAKAFDQSLAERRSPAVLPVTGGVAVVDVRVPHSWEHNSCFVSGGVPVDVVVADADGSLGRAGCSHRRVVLDDPSLAAALADRGWKVAEERLMVLRAEAPDPSPAPGVHAVTSADMHGLWAEGWRLDLQDPPNDVIDQLLRRETLADAVMRIVDLAATDDDGQVVAGAQLRLDGATAMIDAVRTAPHARRTGRARDVVGEAIRRARAAGCDVVWLIAIAADWPREWYARLGFEDVGTRWSAVLPGS